MHKFVLAYRNHILALLAFSAGGHAHVSGAEFMTSGSYRIVILSGNAGVIISGFH